jgi:hypothetical protein
MDKQTHINMVYKLNKRIVPSIHRRFSLIHFLVKGSIC